jgi:hypothetical protein
VKPYATDASVDWMNVTAADLLDRYLPDGWRDRSYGDLLRASPSDWMKWMYPQYGAAQQPYPGMRSAGPQPYGAPMNAPPRHALYDVPRRQPHYPPHPHGCRCPACCERECCRHCGEDPCVCFCCIGEVDLVLYARVGEQRVLPIVVENERRREKEITVELGAWRTRGGGAAPVDTVSVSPKAFKLPPCGEQEVVVVVRVREPATTDTPSPAGQDTTGRIEERGPRDVDGCLVVTADLTLVGCDHRPIRIAIAILPRDCDPFRIDCGCGCC